MRVEKKSEKGDVGCQEEEKRREEERLAKL